MLDSEDPRPPRNVVAGTRARIFPGTADVWEEMGEEGDGFGLTRTLQFPRCVGVTREGLLFCDRSSHAHRVRVLREGVVRTVMELTRYEVGTVDRVGRLFVTRERNVVSEPEQRSYDGHLGEEPRFGVASAVAVTDTAIFLAEGAAWSENRLVVIDKATGEHRFVGAYVHERLRRVSRDGVGRRARFCVISALAVARDGAVYVHDHGPCVRRVDPRSDLVTTVVGQKRTVPPKRRLSNREGLAVDADGTLYFTDNKAGAVYRAAGDDVRTLARDLRGPNSLALDDDRGLLYVTTTDNLIIALRVPSQPERRRQRWITLALLLKRIAKLQIDHPFFFARWLLFPALASPPWARVDAHAQTLRYLAEAPSTILYLVCLFL